MKTLRNLAHDTYAVIGLLLLMQAPVTTYLLKLSTPQAVLDGVFGFFGLVALGHSYWVATHTPGEVAPTPPAPTTGGAAVPAMTAAPSTSPVLAPPPAPPT